MELRYSMEVVREPRAIGQTAINNGKHVFGARRPGAGRIHDLRVFLRILNKDGTEDRRRQMPFEFAEMKVLSRTIHLKWHDLYYRSHGEITVPKRFGRDSGPLLSEVARRLNDLSKKRPYGPQEAAAFLDELRKVVLADEVMNT